MSDEFQMTNGRKDLTGPFVIRHSSFSFLNSIRWRLQIWYGLILVAVLVGFGLTAFQLERGRVYRRVDDELQRRVGAVAAVLRQPPRNRGPEGRPNDRPFDGPPPEDQQMPDNPPRDRRFNEGPPEQSGRGPREF